MLLRAVLKLNCPVLSQQKGGMPAVKQFCKLLLRGYFIKINLKSRKNFIK